MSVLDSNADKSTNFISMDDVKPRLRSDNYKARWTMDYGLIQHYVITITRVNRFSMLCIVK